MQSINQDQEQMLNVSFYFLYLVDVIQDNQLVKLTTYMYLRVFFKYYQIGRRHLQEYFPHHCFQTIVPGLRLLDTVVILLFSCPYID